MNKKLEIELFRYENLLFGKVLHMDDSLREAETLYKEGSIEIVSYAVPALGGSTLYLRGSDKSADNSIFFERYESNEDAIEVANGIQRGIYSINNTEATSDSLRIHRIV